jgi:hypothetical protein
VVTRGSLRDFHWPLSRPALRAIGEWARFVINLSANFPDMCSASLNTIFVAPVARLAGLRFSIHWAPSSWCAPAQQRRPSSTVIQTQS